MGPVDNNQFEVVPTKSKRKIATVCPNVYLNPALDLLANDDPMCNTAMEIIPVKKRKRTRSCDIAVFENSALDIGISQAAVNEFLTRELNNVKKNVRYSCSEPSAINTESNRNFAPKNNYQPSLNSSEPNISTFEPNFSQMNSNLNFSSLDQNLKGISTDLGLETKILSVDPIYANLTEVVAENVAPNNIKPETDVSVAQTTITKEITELSLTAPETNIDNVDSSMPQACEDISKIDDITDSGISIVEQKSSIGHQLENTNLSAINNTNIQTNITNQIFVNNNPSNLSLSFIDRLALDSPNISNQSLIFDDDLNESNIMEIKTITIITTKKRIVNPKKNTNPFLDPNLSKTLEEHEVNTSENPFLDINGHTGTEHTEEYENKESNTIESTEMEYNEEMINRPVQNVCPVNNLMPRRLFTNDNNSTITSSVSDSVETHEYENIDGYRSESPIYENVGDMCETFNKQSKILGHDVSRFSAVDIMNLNKNRQGNSSNESNESKKDFKHSILKVGNKLSKKVYKTLKKTFKGDKHYSTEHNTSMNPYEIPRKVPKDKIISTDSGIENPALNLDNSDIEIEEIDDEDEEHHYETIKTLRNTRLNMNVTPLKERNVDTMDISQNKTNTPGKKVRFDSTLNQEKYITGNSFDYGIQSPGFDAKIDKFHDELENCINEKKILQQNM